MVKAINLHFHLLNKCHETKWLLIGHVDKSHVYPNIGCPHPLYYPNARGKEKKDNEWLGSDTNAPGVQILTDSKILWLFLSPNLAKYQNLKSNMKSTNLQRHHHKCPVSHSAAAHVIKQCLTWLEYQQRLQHITHQHSGNCMLYQPE